MPYIKIQLLVLLPIWLFAQPTDPPFQVARIVTHEYMDAVMGAEWRQSIAADLIGPDRVNSYSSEKPKGNPKIGVVFHVLSSSGESAITEEQLSSQLTALNRDFDSYRNNYRHPAVEKEKFWQRAGHAHIEFGMAREVLTGSGTGLLDNSFRTIEQSGWEVGNAMKSSESGGVDPIAPDRVVNVWVVDLPEDIAGYAQMPGGPIATDGIVIDRDYVGIGGTALAPYDEGKTLTHLMGNYLGIYSLWGVDYCADDGAVDTPVHNAPNYGCPEYKNITTCGQNKGRVEMTMNFMDSTNDACRNMFTKGQILRMYKTLSEEGARHGILIYKRDKKQGDELQE